MAKDFVVKQGDTRTVLITIKSSTGSRVDLTSARFWLGIKKSPGDDEYIVLKDGDFFDYTDAATGQVSILLNSNDTFRPPGKYWVEIKMSFPNGRVQRTVGDCYLTIKPAIVAPAVIEIAGEVDAGSVLSGAATT